MIRWSRLLLCLLLVPLAAAAAEAWPGLQVPGLQIIAWHDQTPARAAGLRRLGVTAGRVFGVRGELSAQVARERTALLRDAGLGFYVENVATDFYAAYHRWQPDHPLTWQFDQARARHARDPADPAAFHRRPGLSDAAALAAIRTRLGQHVRLFGPYRPLFYSLGDETGIADLAAAWDFDVSPASLAAFRGWLRDRYGSLAALEAEWERHFADWDAVMPATTDAAVAQGHENFAAWADFKEFMDHAFAGAVRAGTDAVHAADPAARAGIEGAQVPGWGGYDYTRLAHAVDVMEIYDPLGIEVARALNPGLVVLTTTDPTRRDTGGVWRALLRGSRGLVLWDEAGSLVDDSGHATALGAAWGETFTELRGVAARLDAAPPSPGPVAILHSPASFRVSWLLDRRAEAAAGGPDWTTRTSETEDQDPRLRASMRRASGSLAQLGLTPRWISPAQLESGDLQNIRTLLLPRALALSDAALAAIGAFAGRGGLVLADVPPGGFDAHGRRRDRPPVVAGIRLVPDWRALPLQDAGVALPFTLGNPDGSPARDVEARVSPNGRTTLVALLRDVGSGAGGSGDGASGEGGGGEVALTWPRPMRVRDLRRDQDFGTASRLILRVDAASPRILVVDPGGGRADLTQQRHDR